MNGQTRSLLSAPDEGSERWQKSGMAVSQEQSQTPNTGSPAAPKKPAKDGNDE